MVNHIQLIDIYNSLKIEYRIKHFIKINDTFVLKMYRHICSLCTLILSNLLNECTCTCTYIDVHVICNVKLSFKCFMRSIYLYIEITVLYFKLC